MTEEDLQKRANMLGFTDVDRFIEFMAIIGCNKENIPYDLRFYEGYALSDETITNYYN